MVKNIFPVTKYGKYREHARPMGIANAEIQIHANNQDIKLSFDSDISSSPIQQLFKFDGMCANRYM